MPRRSFLLTYEEWDRCTGAFERDCGGCGHGGEGLRGMRAMGGDVSMREGFLVLFGRLMGGGRCVRGMSGLGGGL